MTLNKPPQHNYLIIMLLVLSGGGNFSIVDSSLRGLTIDSLGLGFCETLKVTGSSQPDSPSAAPGSSPPAVPPSVAVAPQSYRAAPQPE